MEERIPKMLPFQIYSHSGNIIGLGASSPSANDVAVASGRICRYAGNGVHFWPVLLHCFVVMDLVGLNFPHLRVPAMFHDSVEVMSSDIPTTFKNAGNKEVEKTLLHQIFQDNDIYWPTVDEWAYIKVADDRAFVGEIYTVGTAGLKSFYSRRDTVAEDVVSFYFHKYSPMECIVPEGMAVAEFVRRYEARNQFETFGKKLPVMAGS